VNLVPTLKGKRTAAPPSILERSDGFHLLYARKVHLLSAEPESGKGWLAPACLRRVPPQRGPRRLHRLRGRRAGSRQPPPLARCESTADCGALRLSPEEVLAVSRAADDQQDGALFTVAAFTGLRMGELRALRWSDVDFANRNLFVRHNRVRDRLAKPKSGKVRAVPLIDQAAVALDGLSRRGRFTEPSDLVFVSDTGSYLDDGDLRKRFYAALKRAGLGHKCHEDPPLRFHDLRHTFGTLAVQVWPLVDVQSYMGHANISTTMIYAHHVPKHGAADALTRLVDDAFVASESRTTVLASRATPHISTRTSAS
jgi:integrase